MVKDKKTSAKEHLEISKDEFKKSTKEAKAYAKGKVDDTKEAANTLKKGVKKAVKESKKEFK